MRKGCTSLGKMSPIIYASISPVRSVTRYINHLSCDTLCGTITWSQLVCNSCSESINLDPRRMILDRASDGALLIRTSKSSGCNESSHIRTMLSINSMSIPAGGCFRFIILLPYRANDASRHSRGRWNMSSYSGRILCCVS